MNSPLHRRTARGLVLLVAIGFLGCKGSSQAPTRPAKSTPHRAATSVAANSEAPKANADRAASQFASDAYIQSLIAAPASENWYGIYMAGRKAGSARMTRRRTESGEPGGYVLILEMRITAQGAANYNGIAYYFANSAPYPLVAVHAVEGSNAGVAVVEHVATEDGSRVTTTIAGKPSTPLDAPALCDTLGGMLATFAPDVATLRKGASTSHCTLDTEANKQKQEFAEIVGVSRRNINGVAVRVAEIKTRSGSDTTWSKLLIAEGGTVLRATMGPGFVLQLEDKEQANSDVVGISIEATAIAVSTPLGDPGRIRELHLVLGAPDGYTPPSSPNQRVTRRGDGGFDMAIFSVPGHKVASDERQASLAATPSISSDDPDIVSQARAIFIAAGAKTIREKVSALNHWVYASMTQTLSSNLSTASQIMQQRAGDCTEHALLMVALLRASGIAAREVSGVTYAGDEMSAFAWHAWVEAEIDGRWVQVDPSWHETIANATHIKLEDAGTNDSAAAFGALSIEVRK